LSCSRSNGRCLVGLVSYDAQPDGWIPKLSVEGRASRHCDQVRVTLRVGGASGALLWIGTPEVAHPASLPPGTGPYDPENDGAWWVTFLLDPDDARHQRIRCGIGVWIEVECIAGGGCTDTDPVSGRVPVTCKPHPDGPPPPPGGEEPSGPGGAGPGGTGSGGPDDPDWEWPEWWDPPHIQCPKFGRRFTEALLAGLLMVALGVAMSSGPVITLGLVLIGGAGVIYTFFWRPWCVPDPCWVRGAVVWALKNATAGAAGLALVFTSWWAALLVLVYGAIVGWQVQWLQDRRCPVPSLLDPLSSLQF
jgi:hypothetical protein